MKSSRRLRFRLSRSMVKLNGREFILWPSPTTLRYGHCVGRWDEVGGSFNRFRKSEFGKMKIHPWEWEYLLGFPKDWTALPASEIPLILESRKSSRGQSGG
jgi:hypothetical protein